MKSRPYISINMIMTLDGKITTARREPVAFSSAGDKRLLVELRARADAIMAGGRTVRHNAMSMGVPDSRLRRKRLRAGKPGHPLRVIVSGTLRSLSPGLRVFQKKISPVLVFCSEKAPAARRRLFSRLSNVVICGKREVDLRRACMILRRDFGVRHLHVEGGAQLNGGLLDAGLVDELDLTLAGIFFGGREAPTLAAGRGVAKIKEALEMKLVSVRQVGSEFFLRYLRR